MARERTTAEQRETVSRLESRYGHFTKIPESYLTKLGYRLMVDDEMKMLRRISYVESVEQRRVKTKEQKAQDVPFGEIKVKLFPSERQVEFRTLSEEDTNIFVDKVEEAFEVVGDYLPYDPDDLAPKNMPLYRLLTEYNGFLIDDFDFRKVPELSGLRERMDFINPFMISIYEPIQPLIDRMEAHVSNKGTFIFNHAGLAMDAGESEGVFGILERTKGVVRDEAENSKRFLNLMNRPEEYTGRDGDEPEQVLFRNNSLGSRFEITTHLFGIYITHLTGSEAVPSQMKAARGPEELLALLEKTDLAPALGITEKELTAQVKSGTIEDKRRLSRELQQVREQRKFLHQIKLGLIQYYDFPATLKAIFTPRINDLQDFLLRKITDKEPQDLYLDGRPDPIEDRDPGKISGDCTEGTPLPFDLDEVPAYNVKVRNKSKKHIGNIYLLKTQTPADEEEPQPVWHLEAIQIPIGAYNWQATIADIIEQVGKEAVQKGIKLITCNSEPETISNYDYIRRAITEDQHAMTNIIVPKIPADQKDKYSQFQSTGTVRILWQSPPKSNTDES